MPSHKPKFSDSHQYEKELEREIAELESQLLLSRQKMIDVLDKVLLAPEDELNANMTNQKRIVSRRFSSMVGREIDAERHF
jgi:hypothetical protein